MSSVVRPRRHPFAVMLAGVAVTIVPAAPSGAKLSFESNATDSRPRYTPVDLTDIAR